MAGPMRPSSCPFYRDVEQAEAKTTSRPTNLARLRKLVNGAPTAHQSRVYDGGQIYSVLAVGVGSLAISACIALVVQAAPPHSCATGAISVMSE